MKKLLEYILTSIVEEPEEVKIEESEENGVINYTISVAKDDMGKVIGKNGKIIKAIRNVAKIPAVKSNKRIYINLADQPQ